MADCQLFGLHPAGHHATSIVLHALNAALLFLLLYQATGFRLRSLFVAALFALHPLNVETVAWVAERKSILSMLFSLCTIALYGWYTRSPRPSRYLAVAAAFALALLSKPMAVTLPVVLLLLDYWPLNRISFGKPSPGQPRTPLSRLLLEKLPLFLMTAVSCVITIVAQKHGEAISTVERLPIAQRLENTALAYATYIRRMFWPSDLAYFYPHRGSAVSALHAALAALLLLAITALVWRFRQRRHLVFGWLFFLITLLPVIGILQVGLQSMADRYAYVPLIGLFIAVAWELTNAASRLRLPASFQAVAALVIVALAAGCTMVTEGYWQSSLTLFTRAHNVTSPPSLFVETNLAGALSDEGRFREALVYYRNAESLAPTVFATHYNLAYTLARLGDHAAAITEFQQALRYANTPAQQARALNSLGIAALNLGDNRQALAAFTQLLSLQPQNAEARARIAELQNSPPAR
jgi:tetratricopeptide (TPR) repeat protein